MKQLRTQRDREIQLKSPFTLPTLVIITLTVLACGAAGPRPLSIKMFNPKTQSTLDCTARDLGLADRNMLADSVEACARQLEKNGFVRESSTP